MYKLWRFQIFGRGSSSAVLEVFVFAIELLVLRLRLRMDMCDLGMCFLQPSMALWISRLLPW